MVGGTVYVTTTDGVLAAIDEMTGVLQWSHTVASGFLSSVAVDSSSHLVIVGDNRGDVDAFTTVGSPVWNVPTGGPVVATPAISGGHVFVGSTTGEVLELDESTGATIWTAVTGGPVTAAVTIAPNYVTVGSGDGDVYTYRLDYRSAPSHGDHRAPSRWPDLDDRHFDRQHGERSAGAQSGPARRGRDLEIQRSGQFRTLPPVSS